MLVFRPLGPGRDHVRELEPAWRWAALGDPAGVVGHALPLDFAAGHVLADVIEVQVDRGPVPAGDPVAGRRVEGDLDRGTVKGLAADEGKQGLVDVLDHPEDVPVRGPSSASGERAAIRADLPVRAIDRAARSLPDRAGPGALIAALPALAGPPPRSDAPTSPMPQQPDQRSLGGRLNA